MSLDFAGAAVMLLTFAVTFVVARTVAKWFWRGRARKSRDAQRAAESRQVRRARERRERK